MSVGDWMALGGLALVFWYATRPAQTLETMQQKALRMSNENKRRYMKTDEELVRDAALKAKQAAFVVAQREATREAFKRAAERAQAEKPVTGTILPLFGDK